MLIAAALLPVLVLTLYSAERNRVWEAEAAAARLLQAAELIAAEQAQVVESARQLLTAMATAPALTLGDPRECFAYLAKVKRAYRRYLDFFVLDPDGRTVCASSFVDRGLDLAARDVFREPLKGAGFVVGRYAKLHAVDVPLLPLSYPIHDEDGGVAAVLVTALRLDWLDHHIAAVRVPDAASLLMLGPFGTVLAARPQRPEITGSTVDWWQTAVIQGSQVIETGGDLVAVARTGTSGLTVVVGLPREQVRAASLRLFRLQLGVGAAVLLAAAAAAWAFGEVVIARRVRRLAAVAGRLEAGDLSARYGGAPGGGELDRLGRAFDRMAEALQRRVVDLREREARFRYQSLHDPLTGLANRRAFEQGLQARLRAPGAATAVLLIDLDAFKEVNDTLGHDMGDALLAAVAGRLRACVRGDDLVARLGGDEFAIVLTVAPGAADPEEVGRRALAVLAAPFRLDSRRVRIGASAGVAVGGREIADGRALVKRADAALYAAKAAGRGTYRLAEPAISRPAA